MRYIGLGKKFQIIMLLAFTFFVLFPGCKKVFAQTQISTGVAQYYEVSEPVEPGNIISLKSGKFIKSTAEYDPSMYGIVAKNPALALVGKSDTKGVPILADGETWIKISAVNGDIKIGDPITSSKIPGVGMKQVKEGFSIAIAREDYSSPNKEDVGLIKVLLNKNYVYADGSETGVSKKPLLENFNISAFRSYDSMSEVLKLGFAMILIVSSFGFGFLTFKRIAIRAVEATGRNPLASKKIMSNLIINIVVTVLIIGAGLALSYFVLAL